MKRKFFVILLLVLFPFNLTIAKTTKTSTTPKAPPVFFCPPAAALKKNPVKLTWYAEHHTYRSYDTSFSTKVHHFSGAQWVGANVGQLTCIYNMLPKKTFPVLLIFHTLTREPSGKAWTKNKGGYRNCFSLHRKDCPFVMNIRKKQTDIFKEAEKLKE